VRGHFDMMGKASEVDQETGRPGLRAELFVSDVPRSAAFYREVLGLETLREAPSGYTSIGREGAVLGLIEVAQVPEGHPARPRPGHAVGLGVELVVVVEDVAALHARAAASGQAEVSALVAQPWGLTDFRVVDPDGYYIRITGQSAVASPDLRQPT
jgi:catechol 2,3-dioxygenase-like lactoylglutathione lyase family enzyme